MTNKTQHIPTQYYTYTTGKGDKITVYIEKDAGLVNGLNGQWHKVICRPIGFNNSIPMTLDKSKLIEEYVI